MQQINDASCYKSVSTNKSDNDDDEMLVCVENYFAYKAHKLDSSNTRCTKMNLFEIEVPRYIVI